MSVVEEARTVCDLEGCDNSWPSRSRRGDAKFCSRICVQRNNYYTRAAARARKQRGVSRHAVKGRQCVWCQVTDSERMFDTETECSACYRQRYRSRCTKCQGPFYLVQAGTRTETGCLLRWSLSPPYDCASEAARRRASVGGER